MHCSPRCIFVTIVQVHEFCRNWNIFDDLKYEILDFFLSSKGVFLENSNIKSVLHSLPPDYQCIVAPYLAKDCISRTALFKGCNPEFLSLLLESLSLESFSAGEPLFELGDTPHSLYIVKSGTCVLVNENNAVRHPLPALYFCNIHAGGGRAL